ncbi:MAG: penicillin acylase family protein [Telluria sp.]
MLLYGQSVDPASLYYADQLPLYLQKRWLALPFSEQRVKADPAYRKKRHCGIKCGFSVAPLVNRRGRLL